ncbi:unnamed protein product [Allacma fusca]|uniref:Cytochrome P450 n=1 Tax=Allacma fusca TaxID=39272 RepID=A0A8J2K7V1_9HEXA|nr:unnamed protein product [Allacma fusca]
MIDLIFDLMDGLIKTHLEEYDPPKTNDFIDTYLHRHMRQDGSSFSGKEGIQNLRVSLLDLFVAGTETTSTTLVWAVLFMSQHLKVQEKLHQEIDKIIGNGTPSRDDRAKTPYLEAFTNEVNRKATLLPMTVLHKAMKDTEIAGFTVRKGTVILPSIYAAHHDVEYWGDPEVFRPKRFLDSSGSKVTPKDALMPFSTESDTVWEKH